MNHPSKRSSRLLTALYRLSKSLIMTWILAPRRPTFWRKSDIHVGGFSTRLSKGPDQRGGEGCEKDSDEHRRPQQEGDRCHTDADGLLVEN